MSNTLKFIVPLLSMTAAFPYTLPPVTIKAKKIEPLSFAKETISYQDIEKRGESTLSQVLMHQPSIQFSSYGGVGAPAQLSLQGGNINHTLVTIDGVSAEDPSTPEGAVNFAGFSADSFDELSIQKGPLSGFYGAGSLSGSIRLESEKGKGAPKHKFSYATGSHGTNILKASSQGQRKRFAYNIHVSELATQGTLIKPDRLRSHPRDYLTDKANLFNMRGRFDADLTDSLSLTWLPRYSDTHNYYNGYYPSRQPSKKGYTRAHQNVFRLNHLFAMHDWTADQEFSFGLSHKYRRDSEAQPPYETIDVNHGDSEQFKYQLSLQKGDYKVLTGVTYQKDQIKTYQVMNIKNLLIKKSSYRKGVFIAPGYEKSLGKHRFALKTAGHLDSHQGFKDHFSYAAGVIYESPYKTKYSFSYGTAFKAPTLYQRYVNTTFMKGNPFLKPETMRGAQFSIHQQLPHDLSFEVLHFRHHIKQLIETQKVGSFYQYVNANKAFISGFEEKITWAPGSFKLSLAHAYTYTHNHSNRQSLLRRPRNGFVIDTGYDDKEKLAAGLTFKHRSKPYDIDPKTSAIVEGASTTTLDAYTHYQIARHIGMFLRLENMLNKKNEMPLGYLQSGFTALVGMKVTL